ncbi:MAG: hypothetical protein HY747_12600 [Elusimicrobia bacterium]|nr:hypothetical protein [Elusimicrobiota bacterium]
MPEGENLSQEPQTAFGEIETLDAAKVALRWTQERLGAIEAANRELLAKLEAVSAVQSSKEKETDSLRKTLEEKAKQMHEQEAFFEKLASTYKFLSDGKMDINILIQKQLELETLQKRLIDEHQKRLLDLEHGQQQIQERWHERLLDLESQYSQRLAAARQKFEALRQTQDENAQKQIKGQEQFYEEKERRLAAEKDRLEAEHAKRLAALETAFVQKRASFEKEFEDLKTGLYSQIENERAAVLKGAEERVKIIEQTLGPKALHLEESLHKKDLEAKSLEARLKEAEEKMITLESRYHQEMASRLGEYEREYSKRLEALEAKERDLANEHLNRKQELEASFDQLKKRLEDREIHLELQARRQVEEAGDKFDAEKALLEEKLQAALESSQALSLQFHELQEAGLQETLKKEARWSKEIGDLKGEKDAAEAHWLKEIKQLKEEFLQQSRRQEEQIRVQEEAHHKKMLDLESQVSAKKAALEQNYQALEEQLGRQSAEQKAVLERQTAERIKALEQKGASLESERSQALRQLNDFKAEMSRFKTQEEEDQIKKMSEFESEHHSRIKKLEERAAALETEDKKRDRALETERQKLSAEVEKRRLELDDFERILLKRLEELDGQKQEKEKDWKEREEEFRRRDEEWSRHRRHLENLYSQKAAQLEKVKQELLTEIEIYKGAKTAGRSES